MAEQKLNAKFMAFLLTSAGKDMQTVLKEIILIVPLHHSSQAVKDVTTIVNANQTGAMVFGLIKDVVSAAKSHSFSPQIMTFHTYLPSLFLQFTSS